VTEKRRALVLGGGGPVGVGWEVGLAAGLASGGIDLTEADFVVGTSAGSITGSFLMGGADPTELAGEVGALFSRNVAGSGVDQVDLAAAASGIDLLIGVVADVDDGTQQERMAKIGRFALDATTISEEAYVGSIASGLGDRPWPERFACTAVNAETGEFQVWDERSNVPLAPAVASSCAVPGVYPPVTIDGARYVDGGSKSPLNADLATGYDAVIVVSCMPMALPPGLADERFQRFFDAQQDEIEALRASGASVELVVPDQAFLEVSGYGLSLLDFSRIDAAVGVGTTLGKEIVERIGTIW
jgi:NTE family protein